MYKRITFIALKGIALAMGLAVIVLSTLGSLNVRSALTMIGLGLFTLAMALRQGK